MASIVYETDNCVANQTLGFWTEGKKTKETAEDKYIQLRTTSNNICIPDLLPHRGILTLHNELVKILKLPLQGLDQKPTQSPAIKKKINMELYLMVCVCGRYTVAGALIGQC